MRNTDKVPNDNNRSSLHHLFWPADWYKGNALERRFHRIMTVKLSRDIHDLLHFRSDEHPPDKPTPEQMQAMVDRYGKKRRRRPDG